jgi:S1-C subfamily serine protease
MNLVDAIVLVVVGVAIFRGWQRGFVAQIFELGGGFVGLLAGLTLGPRAASMLTDQPGPAGVLISIGVLLLLVSIGQVVGVLLAHRFSPTLQRARLSALNSSLGAGLGVAITALSFWLIASLLVNAPSRSIARAVRDSAVLGVVNDVLPRPPDVLAYLRQYLSTSGFPQVFAGLPPPIGEPVRLPSNAQAGRAGEAADQSTVRVRIPACGGVQLGSGWVAATGTVVTNAHVVAGGNPRSVVVEDTAGIHEGVVVSFDDQTDVAVIHVFGLGAPALQLDTRLLERGTPGATLGYPGGAGLQIHRAAIQAQHEATGLDIYGRSEAERDIYELRAVVRQGDSGGPFVLPSGDVAGVVFAASTTDEDTGYALVGAEVEDDIRRGSGRTDPVDTGGCTH